jgi:2-polyprenyl-6-methoxyphenol hydroxylase-like FAD-dependent oxidoreductase
MKPQVLIVGAGPVGLTMAAELARYGVSVRIVEKAAHRSDKSKALVIWSRTLELLERSGCAEALVAAGHKVLAANIIAGTQRVGRIGLADVASPFPYALMLPQSDTERLLERHLASLGVAVERRVELSAFNDMGAAVSATLRLGDGTEEILSAKWLIGCDGAHSTVRHALGLEFTGDTLKSDWVLADLHLAGLQLPSSELALYWHRDGVLALFPISDGRYRIIADIGQSSGPQPSDPTLTEMQAIVDQRGPGGLLLSEPIWLSAFRINERKIGSYRSGRVFLAGDAAHVHSPAGGQGMNTGMQDAINLAWKLALSCQGICNSESLLDSYSIERSAVGAQVLAAASRLTALAIMKGRTAQTLRNWLGGFILGLAPVRRIMAEILTEISVSYGHSPLNGTAARDLGSPRPGARMPPVAGQTPVGAGESARFALFATPCDATAQLLLDYPDLVEPQLRPPFKDGGVWLVRPDGYTACTAKGGDVKGISDYLRALENSGPAA